MRKFNPSARQSARALQAWQILAGKAMNRQTVTYEGLSVAMFGKRAAGVLADILGHIAFYCIDEGIPPLTAIVVGKYGGRPGEDIPVPISNIDEEREKVYRFDWYDCYPPTETELSSAYESRMN